VNRLLSVSIFLAIWSSAAKAEYRVFILEIKNSKSNVNRQIQSTLDPEQYKSLNPLSPDETITYQDTWLCRGNTGDFRQHCARPPN
jgi:flagella basal body P-ring formation protein FlgA